MLKTIFSRLSVSSGKDGDGSHNSSATATIVTSLPIDKTSRRPSATRPTYSRRQSRESRAQKSSSPARASDSASAATRTSPAAPRPSRSKMHIHLPLYIYPTPTSWTPLFTALAAHPDLHFDIIINPANGPGAAELPDANYIEQVTRLASFANVSLYGYVHVLWAERGMEAVLADVRRYAGWCAASPQPPEPQQQAFVLAAPPKPKPRGGPGDGTARSPARATEAGDEGDGLGPRDGPRRTPSPGDQNDATPSTATSESLAQTPATLPSPSINLRLAGIFVDEAPHHPRHVGYMTSLSTFTRQLLPGAKLWFNPGCPVAAAYYALADYVTAFESTYTEWIERGMDGMEDGGSVAQRRKTGVMVHSVPRIGGELAQVVSKAREEGVGGIFVSNERGYETWGIGWAEMVDIVAGRA